MRKIIILAFCFINLNIISAQICDLGTIQFTRQSQVDSLHILYGDCEHLSGSLVFFDDVTNLDSLFFLRKFNGSIRLNTEDSLRIDGLRNLKEVDRLSFSTSKIRNLSPFQNLERVNISLDLNQPINNIWEELENLKFVEELILQSLNVTSLDLFTTIDTINKIQLGGLGNLDSIDFNIFNYPLKSISLVFMDNLKMVTFPEDPSSLNDLSFLWLPNIEHSNLDKITNLDKLNISVSSARLSFPNLINVRSLNISRYDSANIDLGNLIHLSSIKIQNSNILSCSQTAICDLVRFGNPSFSTIENNQGDCENKFTLLQSCYNDHVINTQFYYDYNNDLIKDDNEPFIRNLSSSVTPSPIFTFDSPLIPIRRSLVENGNYTITFDVTNNDWELVNPNQQYSIDVNDNYLEDTFLFALRPLVDVSQVKSFLHNEIERCNTFSEFEIVVENTGYQIENGIYWLELDSKIDSTQFNFFQMPDTIINDHLVGWFFEGLAPSQSFNNVITYRIPGPPDIIVGDSIINKVYLEYQTDNGITKFDTSTYAFEIRCSYDPNDKLVNPNRKDNFTLFNETLHFTVRFQNTGNDVAYDVVVRDTLDDNLDPSTFKFVNSSHNRYLKIYNETERQLSFEFKNIFLPDSTSDFEGSNGYLSYTIDPKQGLDEFTNIKNTASIYFDQNPPIVTNTTENILVSMFPTSTNDPVNDLDISIYPNPADQTLFFSGSDLGINTRLRISSIDGRVISDELLIDNQIDVSTFRKGMYIMHIYRNGKQVFYKILIQ